MSIQAQLPQLALRVSSSSFSPGSEPSTGSRQSPFLLGDEIAVKSLEKVDSWDTLNLRSKQSAQDFAQRAWDADSPARPPWPSGYRITAPRRNWRALVVCSDGDGGFDEHVCLLQVAANSGYRTRRHAEEDLRDWRMVSEYAHRFNSHVHRKSQINTASESETESTRPLPSIQVVMPVGCDVLGSGLPQFIAAGDTLLLIPWEYATVDKFLCDGTEDTNEVAQAFFHYSSFASAGREMVCDIQGAQAEDGSLLLVDPCIIRKAPPTVTDLVGAVAPIVSALQSSTPEDDMATRFAFFHPKCSEICKTFDPLRKGAKTREGCGMCTPYCA